MRATRVAPDIALPVALHAALHDARPTTRVSVSARALPVLISHPTDLRVTPFDR
jgi:hypothetical protein